MRKVQREDCINTEAAQRREWLDTNGLGGYASSTVINCHTRKYHGMLVAALREPRGSFVLLSKVEASLMHGEKEFLLSTNKYPGVYHPTGHQFFDGFEQGLTPSATYRIGDTVVRKSTMMVHGENTVLICYELLEGSISPTLRLRPLLAYRDIHALAHENMHLRPKTFAVRNGRKIDPYEGMPPLYMTLNRSNEFFPGPKWYNSLEYLKERSRGFDYHEDLFCPGVFEVVLKKGNPVVFAASTEEVKNPERRRKAELARREEEYSRCRSNRKHVRFLKFQGRQFLVRNRDDMPSVVAGYHWFGEWGRDTMLALPGLAFCCGRQGFGEEIMSAYASLERDGLLPNYLAQQSSHMAYNSVDASLLFFWTVQQYLRFGGGVEFVQEALYPALHNIVAAHLEGRVPHCRVDESGLLFAGDENTQLTWMDAQAYGRPVTPRHGAAVEINALWYNALRFFLELTRERDSAEALAGRAESAAGALHAAFEDRFWNHEDNCLADVVHGNGQDRSIRPNQVFAISLPHSMLGIDRMRAVIQTVQEHLLTPFGLRTLSPRNPAYAPFYEGGPDQRDAAYHQGQVWPWLAGHFGEAFLKQAEDATSARKFLRDYLKPLLDAFPEEYGIASIPEIYTGDPPHRPEGCIAQAWSVGEVIRLHRLLGGK